MSVNNFPRFPSSIACGGVWTQLGKLLTMKGGQLQCKHRTACPRQMGKSENCAARMCPTHSTNPLAHPLVGRGEWGG